MTTTGKSVAVISGAAQGIGLAIVERFAATSHRVLSIDRNAERLASAVSPPKSPFRSR